MRRIELSVFGLSYSGTKSGVYALLLSEKDGKKRIPVVIGTAEAQAIAIQLEGLKPPRPLSYDLFLSMSEAFNIKVEEVFIHKLEEGVFFAEIICIQNQNRITIDSRTSDAIALALRFKCPIYTTEKILEEAGMIIELEKDVEEDKKEKQKEEKEEMSMDKARVLNDEENKYAAFSTKDLEEALKRQVAQENYEEASIIRDEIKKEKNNNLVQK